MENLEEEETKKKIAYDVVPDTDGQIVYPAGLPPPALKTKPPPRTPGKSSAKSSGKSSGKSSEKSSGRPRGRPPGVSHRPQSPPVRLPPGASRRPQSPSVHQPITGIVIPEPGPVRPEQNRMPNNNLDVRRHQEAAARRWHPVNPHAHHFQTPISHALNQRTIGSRPESIVSNRKTPAKAIEKSDIHNKMSLSYIMLPQPSAQMLPPIAEVKEQKTIDLTLSSEGEDEYHSEYDESEFEDEEADEEEQIPVVHSHARDFRHPYFSANNRRNIPVVPNAINTEHHIVNPGIPASLRNSMLGAPVNREGVEQVGNNFEFGGNTEMAGSVQFRAGRTFQPMLARSADYYQNHSNTMASSPFASVYSAPFSYLSNLEQAAVSTLASLKKSNSDPASQSNFNPNTLAPLPQNDGLPTRKRPSSLISTSMPTPTQIPRPRSSLSPEIKIEPGSETLHLEPETKRMCMSYFMNPDLSSSSIPFPPASSVAITPLTPQAQPTKPSGIQATTSYPLIPQAQPTKPSGIQATTSYPLIPQAQPTKPSGIQATAIHPLIPQAQPTKSSGTQTTASYPPTPQAHSTRTFGTQTTISDLTNYASDSDDSTLTPPPPSPAYPSPPASPPLSPISIPKRSIPRPVVPRTPLPRTPLPRNPLPSRPTNPAPNPQSNLLFFREQRYPRLLPYSRLSRSSVPRPSQAPPTSSPLSPSGDSQTLPRPNFRYRAWKLRPAPVIPGGIPPSPSPNSQYLVVIRNDDNSNYTQDTATSSTDANMEQWWSVINGNEDMQDIQKLFR
ncbi:hypothetical protein NHQ30_004525 [Ciborinia camelliae]|nr:hypothetical protein NHQ30_004525 [Ciborinia camelliae]